MQVARLIAQVVPQTPRLQTCPAAQAFPQAPQLALSVRLLTQMPPHGVAPIGHVSWQVPATQSIEVPHARPHPPQLAGSVWVLAQLLPQSVCTVVQVGGISGGTSIVGTPGPTTDVLPSHPDARIPPTSHAAS